MHRLPRIQDLPEEEIAELLEKQGQRVPAAIVPDLKIFIGEFDGIDIAGEILSGPPERAGKRLRLA